MIRRPKIIVTAAHSVLALQNSELVPAEFVDAVLRLGTRDACACAAAAHKMQRNSSGSVLCSAAKAKRPAEPDLSIALQWLLAVRPDRVESVHVARAFHRGVCHRGHPQRLAHGGSCGQNHVLKFSDRQEVGNFRKARRAHS